MVFFDKKIFDYRIFIKYNVFNVFGRELSPL